MLPFVFKKIKTTFEYMSANVYEILVLFKTSFVKNCKLLKNTLPL